jgi:hypothetical protein
LYALAASGAPTIGDLAVSRKVLGLVADEAERSQLQQSYWEQSEFVVEYVRVLCTSALT